VGRAEILRLPAVEVTQSPGRTLYSFAVDGKLVSQFATVSRIKRTSGKLEGYQRPEVVSHIEEIRNYIESPSPMVPNAVVIAFDSRVQFQPSPTGLSSTYSRTGVLTIPLDDSLADERKPGFIVDGQQRLAAIRDAGVVSFPICVSAFITDDIGEQTEQFLLVNSTKPLPKGLIYELLPTTRAQLPTHLHRRRFPALLLDRLNREESSPFRGLIQTPTNPSGIIKDNSILRMLENSLSDGVLYRFRDGDGGGDQEAMLRMLFAYWHAVSKVFKDAWALPPKKSRLMHGAGIIGMGFVMDLIADRHRDVAHPSTEIFATELGPLKRVCRWTDGFWDFGPSQQRKWNELQNTTKDIELLANHLVIAYRQSVGRRRRAS